MENVKGMSAVVIGASGHVGRATLLALAAQGARVRGVARGREKLERVVREVPGEASALVADATSPEVAAQIVRENEPGLVVVCLGAHAHLAPLDDYTWEAFSEPWQTDLKASFHLCQEALRRPLRPGSTVVLVSSGAAINGSPLSGGYAGAKRMQWLLAGYAQRVSDARKLGLRFVTVVPKQLIVGTETADAASRAYAQAAGITPAQFMQRFDAPLTPEGVADAIVRVARGEIGDAGAAVVVTGKGVEAP